MYLKQIERTKNKKVQEKSKRKTIKKNIEKEKEPHETFSEPVHRTFPELLHWVGPLKGHNSECQRRDGARSHNKRDIGLAAPMTMDSQLWPSIWVEPTSRSSLRWGMGLDGMSIGKPI